MFATSHSLMQGISTRSSSSIASEKWVTVFVYHKDGRCPHYSDFPVEANTIFRLHEYKWFHDAIPGDYCHELQWWAPREEDWVVFRRDRANFFIEAETSSIIIRLSHVEVCTLLGHRLTIQELHWVAPPGFGENNRSEHDVRVPRPDKMGDDIKIIAYPQNPQLPEVFIVRLDRQGRLGIWDYPDLAQALYGCTSIRDATTSGVHVWNPEVASFDFFDMYSTIYTVTGYNHILIRYELNLRAPNLGYWIGVLEMQTWNPLQPENIPFDDLTGMCLAQPALSARMQRLNVSGDVFAGYETAHSGDETTVVGSEDGDETMEE